MLNNKKGNKKIIERENIFVPKIQKLSRIANIYGELSPRHCEKHTITSLMISQFTQLLKHGSDISNTEPCNCSFLCLEPSLSQYLHDLLSPFIRIPVQIRPSFSSLLWPPSLKQHWLFKAVFSILSLHFFFFIIALIIRGTPKYF